ncbi:hypothetical protein HYW58_00235 [Candidatus Kaiserbacteria bacterium]|nr:hypothetical protein [Candidatus Kaiserbacteria bacterium]
MSRKLCDFELERRILSEQGRFGNFKKRENKRREEKRKRREEKRKRLEDIKSRQGNLLLEKRD